MDGKPNRSNGSISQLSASNADSSTTMESLKETITKLRVELEVEQKNVKQLRREKIHQVQQVREQEATKTAILLKDLRAKLREEKQGELELQKEALNRKFEIDFQKVSKQKDVDITKLRKDLQRSQDELQEVTKRGLSGSARDAFEAERTRLLHDLQELRSSKRHLEEDVKSAKETEKQRLHELKRIEETKKCEISKIKKEADAEIRKLLDELKARDRQLRHVEQELGSHTANVTKLQLENDSMNDLIAISREASSWVRRSPSKTSPLREVTEGGSVRSTPDKEDCSAAISAPEAGELRLRLRQMEDRCTILTKEKEQLQTRNKEVERKRRVTQDKNKKFLEKNVNLTQSNRELEEQLKAVKDHHTSLKTDIAKANEQIVQLKECLHKDIDEQDTVQYLKQELEDFNTTFEEQDKTILALKMACMEKDRRIDLLAQRKKKQRRAASHPKRVRFSCTNTVHILAAGLKETYFGYDEDCVSEGGRSEDSSEPSAQSCLSLSREESSLFGDDNVFHEPKYNDTDQQFMKLSREHLELEKAYALLQSNTGCHHETYITMPMDTGWQEEKETLNKTIKMLKDKVRSQETHEGRLRHQLEEITEHNEVLEFRLLELEDLANKNEAPSVRTEAQSLGPEDMETDSVESLTVKVGALEGAEVALMARCNELEEQVTELGDHSCQLQEELNDMVAKCQVLEQELQEAGDGRRSASPSQATGTQTDEDMQVDELSDQGHVAMETETGDNVHKLPDTTNGATTSPYTANAHQGAPVEVHSSEVESLKEQVSLLEVTRGELQTQVDELKESQQHIAQHEFEIQTELAELKNAYSLTKKRMAEVEHELDVTRAREKQCLEDMHDMEEQHNQRVHSLVQQVQRLEENESSLNESISDMKELERELRDKLDSEQEQLGLTSTSNFSTGINYEIGTDSNVFYQEEDDHNSMGNTEMTLPSQDDDNIPKKRDSSKHEQLQQHVKLLEERLLTAQQEIECINGQQGTRESGYLENQVEELTQREGDLMEEIYQMKLENQELQEHIDELIEQHEENSGESESDSLVAEGSNQMKSQVELVNMIEELELKVKVLTKEKSELKNQLLRSKLDPLDDFEELSEGMVSPEAIKDNANAQAEKCARYEVADLSNGEMKLKSELCDSKSRELNLTKKVELVMESEGRLMDRVQELEEELEQLNKIMDRQEGGVVSESGYDTLQVRVSELEQCKDELNRTVEELESGKDSLKHRLNEYHQHDNEELVRLQEKVEILLNTEEKLVDRIKESEEIEEGLREELTIYKNTLSQQSKSDKEDIDLNDDDEDVHILVVELREKLSRSREAEIHLRNQLNEIEQSEKVHQTQLSDLKHHNNELVEALRSLRGREEVRSEVVDDDSLPSLVVVPHQTHDLVNDLDLSLNSDQQSYMDSISTYVPVDMNEMSDMSREEMASKIYELQKMEIFHRGKISELTANLKSLRQAVEVVTISMETDADVPILKLRSATKDSEFEARLHELVRSEVSLKLRVLELEKKEGVLKRELTDAEAALREQEVEFRHELEEQEHELDQARRQHARLRNHLEYGGESTDETATLSKIQHLEGLVFDLEGSERKLQRQVADLKATEEDLTGRLTRSENNNTLLIKPGQIRSELDDREKLAELINQIQVLQNSDQDLQSRLITSDEAATKTALLLRVSELERSEKGLQRKVELLESLSAEKDHTDFIMLDSPEDVLRQRIKEHEKMEKHLRQQIVELERDREELHEIARKDKNHIHELNVQVRELQLSDKGCKDQLNKMEVHEGQLQNRVDDLLDRIEELEELLRRLQTSEQRLKSELGKRQRSEDNLSLQLENSLEDLQSTEQKLQKKLNEMEKARRELEEKNFDLIDRVGDLEGTEVSLRQKVRTFENSDKTQKEQLNSLESREFDGRSRNIELETINEGLQHQVKELEEEKARLLMDVGQLEVKHGEGEDEVVALRRLKAQLQENVDDLKHWKDGALMRLDEGAQKEVMLQQRTSQCERAEKDAKDRVVALEQQLQEALQRFEELQQEPDETAFLKDQINHHLVTIKELQDQLDELHNRLRFYENDANNSELMTIPRSELGELKQQADKVVRLQTELQALEKEREDLNEIIHELQDGTVGCGHETELRDLKEKADAHNQLLKVQQQQQQKYDDLRNQLQFLQAKVKSGELPARDLTSCGVQVRLADSFTLTHLSPDDLLFLVDNHKEFKTALMKLGAKHPGAYQDFVRHLEPGTKAMSRINVTNHSPDANQTTPQVSSNTSAKRPIDEATEQERTNMIRALANTLPTEDLSLPTEIPLWDEIEARDPRKETELREGPFWSEVEGSTDDLMLTVDVFGITDDSSSDVSIDIPRKTRVAAPPLPSSLPPPTRPRPHIADSPSDSSLYLPSSQHADDSADEADEIIDEDDGAVPTKFLRGLTPPRARSLERDSDFSEGSYIPSSVSPRVRRRGGKAYRMAGSLESIPDSGTGSMRQDDPLKVMKDTIHDLQHQLKAKERELEVGRINQRELEKKVKDSDEAFTLKAKDGSVTVDLENNVAYLKHSLERKDKHINDKKNENDRITKELEKYQKDFHNLTNDYQRTVDELNDTQKQLGELRTSLENYGDLEQQYSDLQKQHTALVALHRACSSSAENVQTLEKIVLKLRGQLKDSERIQLEHRDLTAKLQELEEQLRHKAQIESELTQDNAKLKHNLDAATRDLAHQHELKDQYKKASAKLNEMSEVKARAQTMLTPLRAQVLRLSKLCKSKDELISRLADAMQQSGGPSDLLQDVQKEQKNSNVDYHRPMSPLTQETNSLPVSPRSPASDKSPSRIPRLSPRSRSRSIGNLAPTALFPETNGSVTIDDFVLTPPQLSYPPVTQLPGSSPRSNSRIPHHQNLKGQRHGRGVEPRVVTAVKDYDPQLYSQSGRPDEELELQEGDRVTVLGATDSTGYLNGAVGGREGLVPAAYLQPTISHSNHRTIPPSAGPLVPATRVPKTGPPAPPSEFRVQRVVGQHGVLLAWTAPNMDELARSNGCTVTGYKIVVDSRDQQLVRSPHLCLALVEKLNLHCTHNFSIQTLADYGLTSSAISTLFHSGATLGIDSELLWSDADSFTADADVSSSTSHQDNSEQRVFVAVYDYHPTSSTTTSVPQLTLRTGDLILTQGAQRDDGFFYAKVGGNTGLVPKAFIEEVAVFNQRQNPGAHSSSQQTLASVEDVSHGNSSHGSLGRSHQTSRASSTSHKMTSAIV